MPIPLDNPLCYVGTHTLRTVPREQTFVGACNASPYDSLIQLLYEKLVDFFVRQGFGKISSTGAYLLYVTERNFVSNDA